MRTILDLTPALTLPPVIPPPSIWEHRTVVWITSLPHNNPAQIAKVVLIVSALLATAIYYLFRKPPPAHPEPPITPQTSRTTSKIRPSGCPRSPFYLQNGQHQPVPIPFTPVGATAASTPTKQMSTPRSVLRLRRRVNISPSDTFTDASTSYSPLSSDSPAYYRTREIHELFAREGLQDFLASHGNEDERFSKLMHELGIEASSGVDGSLQKIDHLPKVTYAGTHLSWHEIFAALGYFAHVSNNRNDDQLAILLMSDSPTFNNQPLFRFFRDFNTELSSEDPWEQTFFKPLKLAYFRAHLRIADKDHLFDLAYRDLARESVVVELSLDSTPPSSRHSPMNSPGHPATPIMPVTPTIRIPISPLEEACEKWAENPVVQWIICKMRAAVLDWVGRAVISKEPYLANFQRVIVYLYLDSKVDTSCDLTALEGAVFRYLQTLHSQLKEISILTSKEEMTQAMQALSDEERSRIFESYLFFNTQKSFFSALQGINPDWEQKTGPALAVLERNGIKLVPEWNTGLTEFFA